METGNAKGALIAHQYPAGSEWRKWDLHAHTPLDHEWASEPNLVTDVQKQSFARQFVESALTSELSVVAITDHNFCSSIDLLLIPYIREAAQQTGLTILPGFEVTVSDCGGTHILAIFEEDASLNTIDEVISHLFAPGADRFRGAAVVPSTEPG